MKIHESTRPAALARRKEAGRSSDSGFRVPAGRADGPSPTAPGAPLAAPGSILALQEVGDATDARRRAIDRGHDLLDQLENLKLAMVEGWLSEDALRRLSSLVENGGTEVDDDRLQDVVRDIEVRAAVEIAKRDGEDPSSS